MSKMTVSWEAQTTDRLAFGLAKAINDRPLLTTSAEVKTLASLFFIRAMALAALMQEEEGRGPTDVHYTARKTAQMIKDILPSAIEQLKLQAVKEGDNAAN